MMNERIRHLAILCTEECGDYHIGSNPQFNYEKFAELIVRECIEVVTDAVDHREPASTYVNKIREHFGVEE